MKKQGFSDKRTQGKNKLRPTCEYPCQWDDLIDSRKKVIVHSKEINNEVVRNALKDLEKATGKREVFVGSPSREDKIIAYAERLMRPLRKYGDPDEGYDFSKAGTARQKAEVIGIWIGEILYEALAYKDVKVENL